MCDFFDNLLPLEVPMITELLFIFSVVVAFLTIFVFNTSILANVTIGLNWLINSLLVMLNLTSPTTATYFTAIVSGIILLIEIIIPFFIELLSFTVYNNQIVLRESSRGRMILRTKKPYSEKFLCIPFFHKMTVIRTPNIKLEIDIACSTTNTPATTKCDFFISPKDSTTVNILNETGADNYEQQLRNTVANVVNKRIQDIFSKVMSIKSLPQILSAPNDFAKEIIEKIKQEIPEYEVTSMTILQMTTA
jgi:uncharacterized membrane protein YqiK